MRASAIRHRLKNTLRNIPLLKKFYRSLKSWNDRNILGASSFPDLERLKEKLTADLQRELTRFLKLNEEIVFCRNDDPLVSVVIVLFNRAELTLRCLRSLAEQRGVSFEIVVVDNASSDQTRDLLSRVRGITSICNKENLHFLRGSNQGAAAARGKYLLLLNSDTELEGGAISRAASVLEENSKVGVVGGKLILPNGQLQEAGSIVWQDGTCLGYGRGDVPERAQYMFRRDVDYVSGAFFLTRRELFLAMGGLDEAFSPAYYEETDYCLRLWRESWRTVYEPSVVVKHFEFASSLKSEHALELQKERREVLVRRHAGALGSHLPPAAENVLAARCRPLDAGRLLFIDERLAHLTTGAGYPRANQMLRAALSAGWSVGVLPAVYVDPAEDWPSVYSDLPREIEVLAFPPYGPEGLRRLLEERRGYYRAILISRPTTMQVVRPLLEGCPELFAGVRLIYDAEAIFSLRDELYAKVTGQPLSAQELDRRVSQELSLAKGIDTISTVCEGEAERFRERGFKRVHVISHAVEVDEVAPGYEGRADLLFVGAVHDDFGPNPDSIFWFLEKAFPLLRASGLAARFVIAGTNNSRRLSSVRDPLVTLLGRVEDLTPVYNAARVFVAPTRFSAGIPLKVIEAAAHGLPIVASALVAEQLGWEHGKELLIGDSPEAFAEQCQRLYADRSLWESLRKSAGIRVGQQFSKGAMKTAMSSLLDVHIS